MHCQNHRKLTLRCIKTGLPQSAAKLIAQLRAQEVSNIKKTEIQIFNERFRNINHIWYLGGLKGILVTTSTEI